MKKQYRSSSSTDPASAAAIRFVANMDFHSQTLNTIGMQPHTIDSPAIPVSFWLMVKEAIGITAQRLKLSGAGMNQRPEARLAITLPTKAHNSAYLFSISHIEYDADGAPSSAIADISIISSDEKESTATLSSTTTHIYLQLRYTQKIWMIIREIRLTAKDTDLLYLSLLNKCYAVAELLRITEACVKKRKKALCRKLGVDNFQHAIFTAISLGMLSHDERIARAHIAKITESPKRS